VRLFKATRSWLNSPIEALVVVVVDAGDMGCSKVQEEKPLQHPINFTESAAKMVTRPSLDPIPKVVAALDRRLFV